MDVTAGPDIDRSGEERDLFVMMIDVTARRDAEHALLKSENRLRMLADNMPAIVKSAIGSSMPTWAASSMWSPTCC